MLVKKRISRSLNQIGMSSTKTVSVPKDVQDLLKLHQTDSLEWLICDDGSIRVTSTAVNMQPADYLTMNHQLLKEIEHLS